MTYPTPTHSKDCAYHLDQYSWECDCGAWERFRDEPSRIEKAAMIGLWVFIVISAVAVVLGK